MLRFNSNIISGYNRIYQIICIRLKLQVPMIYYSASICSVKGSVSIRHQAITRHNEDQYPSRHVPHQTVRHVASTISVTMVTYWYRQWQFCVWKAPCSQCPVNLCAGFIVGNITIYICIADHFSTLLWRTAGNWKPSSCKTSARLSCIINRHVARIHKCHILQCIVL